MAPRRQLRLLLLFLLASLAGLLALGLTIAMPGLARSHVLRIELPQAGRELGLPPVEGPQDASRPLVVIDAGHGGHDPGATGDGFEEKRVALGLSLALRDKLLAGGGIRVALTRSDDRFLALQERVEIARRLGAELFLSIHADSAGEEFAAIRGASIYTLSERASDEAAARLARRENAADEVNGISLSGRSEAVNAILFDLSQRHAQQEAAEFARLIVREGQGALTFRSEPLRSAALAVLRAPDVPSVLFEAGFISNEQDAQRLASPEGRAAFAGAVERAIRVYFARNVRSGGL